MKREQLELEVNRLLHEWIATDTRPSRYAAWLLLLKIWLWKADDGEDHKPFPNEYLNRLIQMVHDQNRATRATALSAVVMIVMKYERLLPKDILQQLQTWRSDKLISKELMEVQANFAMSILGDSIMNKSKRKLQRAIIESIKKKETDSSEYKKRMDGYMKEILHLVEEGVDVNASSFSQVCNTPFFATLKNWLLDFDANHPGLELSDSDRRIMTMSLRNTNLCELDKYAFSGHMDSMLTKHRIGKEDREKLAEIAEMMETGEVEDLSDMFSYRNVFQTMYRFFNYSPWHEVLENPFHFGPYLSDTALLMPILTDDFLWKAAQWFARYGMYTHPAMYLRTLLTRNGERQEWMRLLVDCDQHLGETQEQLILLQKLEEMNPQDISIAQQLGMVLTHMGEYEQALPYLFHADVVESQDPEEKKEIARKSHDTNRAIAWCSLMTRNVKRSERYYKRLLNWEGGPRWEDLLNAGHSAWLSGNPERARILYTKALKQKAAGKSLGKEQFLQPLTNDTPYLEHIGFTTEDINLMCEGISMD